VRGGRNLEKSYAFNDTRPIPALFNCLHDGTVLEPEI
jgi:hypothetical protein